MKIAGGQAGCGADRAVHVFDLAAAYAEGVVVVVARAGFVEGGGSRRLKLTQQVDVSQVGKNHVDGLDRNGGDALADCLHDGVGGGVRVFLHCVEYGEALLGDAAAPGAQPGGPCFFELFRAHCGEHGQAGGVGATGVVMVWALGLLRIGGCLCVGHRFKSTHYYEKFIIIL